MYYRINYFTIALFLAQKADSLSDWNSYDHDQSGQHHYFYHESQDYPVVHLNSFLADDPSAALPSHIHNSRHPHVGHIHEYKHINKYHGPLAIPVVLHSGYLAETPEVAVAKIHHLAAVAQAKADKYYSGHAEHGYGGAYGYSGSHQGYGIPVVLPNGHIADTYEVAVAKSAHLLAVAKANADKYYSGQGEGYGYGAGDGYSSSYHGYGIPLVLPSGHLADTHEVAAAKSAHLTAVAHAKSEHASSNVDHTQHHHENYVNQEPHSLYLNVNHVTSIDQHPLPHKTVHHDESHILQNTHLKSHDEPLGSGIYWFFG